MLWVHVLNTAVVVTDSDAVFQDARHPARDVLVAAHPDVDDTLARPQLAAVAVVHAATPGS